MKPARKTNTVTYTHVTTLKAATVTLHEQLWHVSHFKVVQIIPCSYTYLATLLDDDLELKIHTANSMALPNEQWFMHNGATR